jgi:nucleotide-binding universal stress UspA family protein
LFTSILVPVDGQERGWFALNQALGVARREGGRLLGLHIVPAESDKTGPAVQQIKAEFNRRCAQAGIPGQLAVEAGNVADKISDRARWADLVVIRLVYPPSAQPIARLGSGLRTIIRQARCPLLFVPRDFAYPLDKALLAYDGSPKAQEALYIAAYLASRWQIPLVVVAVVNGRVTEATVKTARDYLDAHRVEATFVQQSGYVAEAILTTAEEYDSSLIIMGGYGYNPVMELVLGSAVDEVLRSSRRPTLICG